MNNLYKEMVRKPGDLCFEVSLESDKGLTMTDLSFALKFFVYGHPKNVCIHKDDLEVVEGKYYAVLNEHGFVNGVLFCEAEIVETINGINRIVSVRSNTGYMIGNCCQPSVDVSSCAHGYSLSLYKVEYVPQPIDPNPEEDQLVAEELFGERLSLPELTADRAIADEHGNRIADTYETRQAVRNHIREVYNEQFNENPPLILDEYITPNMLSQDVKDMLSQAGATINNVPDGEDLTTKNGVLKLSDKSYNPGAYSGLGRVYLRKNLVGGQNLLTQAMVSKPNTIYIIQYDYDLQGETITVPEGCVLQFEGGGISNGKVKNYNKFIKASTLGLYCNNENKAIENSKLFERYINMGFSIELDGAYCFGANSILQNNVNVKGGEYIIKGDMPILLNGEDIDLNLNNVFFSTREEKHIELINRIFIVESNSIDKRPIRSLSIQNCVIDGCRLFTWYSNLDVESINKIPIDNIHISSNSFINTGISSIKINDASVMSVMIKGNIIKNCGIGTFNISSDNLSGVKKGSLCFIGNHIENENVILDNLKSEYSYITPLITEGFNEVFIKNNTFSNIVCFGKNALPYSFYSSDNNLHVSGNTFNNVFNAYNGHPNNVMFKCKGAYNRYLTDNVYIIDKTYLIRKHPNLFKDYDFSKILVNFINIASESDCGNLIVQNNIMCIPGILSCPNVYPSSIVLKGSVLLKNNYIEAQGAEGSLLAFKKYDSSECRGDIVVENNIIKHKSVNIKSGVYGNFALFNDLEGGGFNILLNNNTFENVLFGKNIKAQNTSKLLARKNLFVMQGYNVDLKYCQMFPNSTIEDNDFDYNEERYNIRFSDCTSIRFCNRMKNAISNNKVELYDYNEFPQIGDLPTLIKVGVINPSYKQIVIAIYPVSNDKVKIKSSFFDEIEFDISENNTYLFKIPTIDGFSYSLPKVSTEGDGKLYLVLGGNEYDLSIDRNSSLSLNYGLCIESESSLGIYELKDIMPFAYIPGNKVYSKKDDLAYIAGKEWRNNDGTLISKVNIV